MPKAAQQNWVVSLALKCFSNHLLQRKMALVDFSLSPTNCRNRYFLNLICSKIHSHGSFTYPGSTVLVLNKYENKIAVATDWCRAESSGQRLITDFHGKFGTGSLSFKTCLQDLPGTTYLRPWKENSPELI